MKKTILAISMLIFFYATDSYAMEVVTLTYTGNGVDDRNLTVGFIDTSLTPTFALVYRTGGDAPVWKTTAISGDASFTSFSTGSLPADFMQSLSANTVQVGTDAQVNANGSTYRLWAFAADGNTDITTASYSGNSTDDRNITGVGFNPNFVFIKRSGATGQFRHSSDSGDTSHSFDNNADAANIIQAFVTDGFQVGTDTTVNVTGNTYYYVAMRTRTGVFQQSTYTGNGTDDRNITGVGFQPEIVWVKNDTSGQKIVRSANVDPADATYEFITLAASFANGIQSFASDGFQVGTDATVNTNTDVYMWMAWNQTSDQPAGAPAAAANRPRIIFIDE